MTIPCSPDQTIRSIRKCVKDLANAITCPKDVCRLLSNLRPVNLKIEDAVRDIDDGRLSLCRVAAIDISRVKIHSPSEDAVELARMVELANFDQKMTASLVMTQFFREASPVRKSIVALDIDQICFTKNTNVQSKIDAHGKYKTDAEFAEAFVSKLVSLLCC